MPVPAIEITDHADALRIRRPHGKARSRDALHRAQLRAKLVVEFTIVAFAEEREIVITQRGQEGIRIADRARVTFIVCDEEFVFENFCHSVGRAFEQTGLVNSLQFDGRCGLVRERMQLDAGRVGQQSTRDEAGGIRVRMQTKNRVRGTMLEFRKFPQFVRRENHARTV